MERKYVAAIELNEVNDYDFGLLYAMIYFLQFQNSIRNAVKENLMWAKRHRPIDFVLFTK